MRRWAIVAAVVLFLGATVIVALRQAAGPLPAEGQHRMTAMGLLLLEDEAGLYVLGVIDGSLAGDAGIRPGDYLTMASGTALTTASQLEELLAQPDRMPLPVTLARQDQTLTVLLQGP